MYNGEILIMGNKLSIYFKESLLNSLKLLHISINHLCVKAGQYKSPDYVLSFCAS